MAYRKKEGIYEKNPRRILAKPLADLTKSIDKFGLAEPLVIQPSGQLIGGHARLHVLKAQGATECDCYVASRDLTEKEQEELCLRLNRNIAGEWDFDLLAGFDKDLLLDVGWETEMLM